MRIWVLILEFKGLRQMGQLQLIISRALWKDSCWFQGVALLNAQGRLFDSYAWNGLIKPNHYFWMCSKWKRHRRGWVDFWRMGGGHNIDFYWLVCPNKYNSFDCSHCHKIWPIGSPSYETLSYQAITTQSNLFCHHLVTAKSLRESVPDSFREKILDCLEGKGLNNLINFVTFIEIWIHLNY